MISYSQFIKKDEEIEISNQNVNVKNVQQQGEYVKKEDGIMIYDMIVKNVSHSYNTQ